MDFNFECSVYMILLSSQILKLDVSNGAVKRWTDTADCSPSEPVFVPCPDAQDEDDG
jgi:carotenoid cleavage dioxygenase-like enzyme